MIQSSFILLTVFIFISNVSVVLLYLGIKSTEHLVGEFPEHQDFLCVWKYADLHRYALLFDPDSHYFSSHRLELRVITTTSSFLIVAKQIFILKALKSPTYTSAFICQKMFLSFIFYESAVTLLTKWRNIHYRKELYCSNVQVPDSTFKQTSCERKKDSSARTRALLCYWTFVLIMDQPSQFYNLQKVPYTFKESKERTLKSVLENSKLLFILHYFKVKNELLLWF